MRQAAFQPRTKSRRKISSLRRDFCATCIRSQAELLAEGNREGAWSLADPAFTAIFLFNALHGVVNQDDAGDDGASRAKLLRDIEDNVLRLVR
ncbi:hypothetical protein [Rhizobium sp. BK316]|uniref:hypothetical protein n=1 Tax=Rhizobium sp. BK316 TaxID=2587053 RepID=UPI001AEE49F5